MIEGALQIDAVSTGRLIDTLAAQAPDEDTFLTSPTYFLHTGRRGLWLFGTPERYLIYCHHPNQSGALLIFPQPGQLDVELWEVAARALRRTAEEVTLARVHERYRDQMRSSLFERHEEEILDWRYPCTVLRNADLMDHTGPDFERFRQKLSRFKQARVRCLPLTVAVDREFGTQTRQLIDRWAHLVSKQRRFPEEELRAPNHSAYDRGLRCDDAMFNAAIIVVDERVVAFFTTERPLAGETVNGITMCIDREFGGAAELAHREMVALHHEQGLVFTNINGAETESLDQFRKKLCPVVRYKIDSYHLRSSAGDRRGGGTVTPLG